MTKRNVKFSQNSCTKAQQSKHYHDEKKQTQLREKIHELYFKVGCAKKAIARKLCVSRNTVRKWTQAMDQDCSKDRRGWPRGVHRRWDRTTEARITRIHNDLQNDPKEFFCGASAITNEWLRLYPNDIPPSLRMIGFIMNQLHLSTQKKQTKHKGAAAYLCYPEHTIYSTLGDRVLESDFIGQKFLVGQSQPINFISFSFKKEPKLRHFRRISSQIASEFIAWCEQFFQTFEYPTHIKMDNALAMIGSASGKRNVSRTMLFLLGKGIIPIFAVPRQPFSQASIEGSNSIFSRKFWNSRRFTDVRQMDLQLSWFNDAIIRYHGYQRPEERLGAHSLFHPKVYFLRQVHQSDVRGASGNISILNEQIGLPASLVNYFVLAEWDLVAENLSVFLEKEKKLELIEQSKFPMNLTRKDADRIKHLDGRKLLSF